MSIYKVSESLPITRKIELLNNMIMELNGKMNQGQFDKYELAGLFDSSGFGFPRIYNRDVYLGNTLGTYNSWSHLKAETGYSIWKFPITDYTHSIENALYQDDTLLVNRGEATAENVTAFDYVYLYDGATFTDATTEAASEEGTAFATLEDTDTYIYIGNSTNFNGFKIEFSARGSDVTPVIEYSSSESGIWKEVSYVDNTNEFRSDGYITWDLPTDSATTEVNGQTVYWVRISTSTVPSIAPEIYYLVPHDSVVGLLAMSNDQIISGYWCWCYYNGNIYVTIRNTGNINFLGDYYITSAANATYKQNYFIYNHSFKMDHRNTN